MGILKIGNYIAFLCQTLLEGKRENMDRKDRGIERKRDREKGPGVVVS